MLTVERSIYSGIRFSDFNKSYTNILVDEKLHFLMKIRSFSESGVLPRREHHFRLGGCAGRSRVPEGGSGGLPEPILGFPEVILELPGGHFGVSEGHF